jgi:tripartite ATP-independent transporter DctM subunit
VISVLARRVATIGVAGMLLIALGTIADVLLRWQLNLPIPGYSELVELGIAVAIAATFPAGAANRGNLTIDILAERMSPRLRLRLGCFGALLLLLFYALLAWQLAVLAADSQSRNDTTVYLDLQRAPALWAVAALLAIAATAQLQVFLAELRAALGGTERAGAFPALAVALPALAAGLLYVAAYGLPSLAPAAQAYPGTVAVVLFFVMWGLSLALVPLSVALGMVGVLGAALLTGVEPALNVLGTSAEAFLTNENLAVLPLFLIMGSFAGAAELSSDIYRLAQKLFGHWRGGLAAATIGGCAGFGALTGSSLATAATIGQVALPEMRRRGYSPAFATGCVAAGGTLGQLVPPSTAIILYAILTEESIGRLFIAALVPAAIAVVLYIATIALYVRVAPGAAPLPEPRVRRAELLAALRNAWGVLFLFALVIGGLYGGVFTANEAAAVGAIGTFLFALARGKLSGGALWRVMAEVTRTTAMIYMLIFGAVTFSFFMGISGLPELLVSSMQGLDVAPVAVIFLLLGVYIVLGAVMDPFPVMVITVPIVTPLVTGLGYDLTWWGIIMVCVVETGMITPPFGINVFILKGIAGGEDVPMWTVFRGVLAFVGADLVKLVLLVLFPALVLWLPSTMR